MPPPADGAITVAMCNRARRIRAQAHVNLANALAQTPGGTAEAIAEYDTALRIRPDPVVREMAARLRAKQ
jgi:hypothetical protein